MLPPADRKYLGLTVALTLAALAWGFVNFGLFVWMPDAMVAQGRTVGVTSKLIAQSTAIAAPVVLVSAFLYSRWSTKWSLAVMLAVMAAGVVFFMFGPAALADPLAPLALVIVGASGVIAIILPYTAENYPLRVRGRATGWVAGASKTGGLAIQIISVLALAKSLSGLAIGVGVASVLALVLIVWMGRETRGRDLRELG
jgi:putative MFS transporter